MSNSTTTNCDAAQSYASIQQAYKKNPGEERKPVSFTTPIQAVYDGKTGASLEAILAQFNSIYVQYQGTPKETRLIIPKEMRRAGLTITYMDMESNTITERANSAVQKDNDHWALDVNWSRVDELSLSGDISVSAAGTWIINGQDTGVKALGPKGDTGLTPWLKTIENRLHFSYDNITWEPCSENIAAWFRWSGNKIQISRDNKTWTDLSGKFADNIHIKGYVASTAALPSGAAQGDIYGVGPTYAADDTAHTNPIYRYYVRNANEWVDNGSFTSIAAGITQETGDSETEVMSQKAVSKHLSELGLKLEISFGNNRKVHYLNIDTINGVIEVIEDIYWCYSYGSPKDNYIAKGTKFTIKPSEFRSQVDKGGGLVKFAFNINTGTITTLNYVDLIQPSEVIIGMASSEYGVEYSSFNWVYFNVDWNYTTNGIPLNKGDNRFEVSFMNNSNENYFNVDTVKGTVTVLTDIYWGYSYGATKDNRIPASTEFTIKPSEFRSQVDRGSGLVKFAFDMNTGAIATLQYLDLIKSSEIIIGMASSAYGTTYSSFNWIHFNTDWNYTIDGVSPTDSGASTIFTRNADEVEIMETFGASTWYEEFNYNNYGENSGWIPKLSLIHVSDTHASRNHFGKNYDIITQELVAFANKVSTNRGTNFNRGNRVKCVVHSGDIKYSVGSDDFTYYTDAVKNSNIPFFHALGNHDIGNESTMLVEYAITDAQAYEQMIAPFLGSWNLNCANPGVCEAHPEGKCYFFNDFETEKIRLIILYGFETRFELDESDSTKLKYRRDTESWSQEQIDWLINSLLNLPEGWGVMINQHYPFGTSTGESAFLSYAKCSRGGTLAIINDIVQAFIDGTNLVRQYTQADIITPTLSVNCDFSHKKANTEFIAFLSGHTHRDCIGRIEDYPDQLQLNVGCNNTFYDEGSDVTHAMGKKGQDMFNVYCIDRNNGLINILRIGANISCFGQKRELETIKYR